ncbi:hypothetical protein BLNAU_24332 [Blattamonas nauphoetae]|uniref:Uncharacterized protein n=1 Tax=Blattamonas nauphoetae TaxID=2049346 RepID=A0ABQ9WMS0_9EUKA|nr:hypothetical protein BLNAU_24332 [Blattamonas nauphoetae]
MSSASNTTQQIETVLSQFQSAADSGDVAQCQTVVETHFRLIQEYCRRTPRPQLAEYKTSVDLMWQGLFKKEMYNQEPLPKPHHLLKVFRFLEFFTHCTYSHSDAISTTFRFIRALSVNLLSFQPSWDYGIHLLAHLFKAISSYSYMDSNDRPPQYSSILVAPVVVSASAILEGFVPERQSLDPQTHPAPQLVPQLIPGGSPSHQPLNTPNNVITPSPNPALHEQASSPPPLNFQSPAKTGSFPPPNVNFPNPQAQSHRPPNQNPPSHTTKEPKTLPKHIYAAFTSEPFSAEVTEVLNVPRQLANFAGKVFVTDPTHKDRLTEEHILTFQTLFTRLLEKNSVLNEAIQMFKPARAIAYVVGVFRTEDFTMAITSSLRNSLSNVLKQLLVSTPDSDAVVDVLRSILSFTYYVELTLPVHLFDIVFHVITNRMDLNLAPISTNELCQILLDSYSSFHRRVFNHFKEPLHLSLDSPEQNENLDRTAIVAPYRGETEPALGYSSLLIPRLHVMERLLFLWKQQEGDPDMRSLFFEEMDNALTISELERGLTIFWTWGTDSSAQDRFRPSWVRELGKLDIGQSLRNPVPSDENPFPALVFDPQRKNKVILHLKHLFTRNVNLNHPHAVVFIRILLSLLINPSTHPELSLLSTVVPKEQNQKVVSTLLQNLKPALKAPESPSQQTQLSNAVDLTTTLISSFGPSIVPKDVAEGWTAIDTLNSSILDKFDRIYETVHKMDTTLTRLTTPSSNTNWQLLFSPNRKEAVVSALSKLNRTPQQIRALTMTGGSGWFVRWLTTSQLGDRQELDLLPRLYAFNTLSDILDARSPITSLSQFFEKFQQIPNLLEGMNFDTSTNVALSLTISSMNSFFSEYNSFLPSLSSFKAPQPLADTKLTTLALSDREMIVKMCQNNTIATELISLNLLSSAPPLLQQALRCMKFDPSQSDAFPDVKTSLILLTQFDLKVIEGLDAKGIAWLLPLFILVLGRSNKDSLLPSLQTIIASLSEAPEPTKTIVKRAILNLLSALLYANTVTLQNSTNFTTLLTAVAPIIRPHLVVLCSTLLFIHLWSTNLTQPVHKSFDNALLLQAIKHFLDMIEKSNTLSHLTQILEVSLFDTFTIPHYVFTKLGFFSNNPRELLAGEPELLYRLLLSTIQISPILCTQTLTSLQAIQEAEDRTEHLAPTDLNTTPLLSHHHISFMETVFKYYQNQVSRIDPTFSFLPVFFSFFFNTLLHMNDLSSSNRFHQSLVGFMSQIPPGRLLDYFFRQHNESLVQKNKSSLLTSFFFHTDQTSFIRFDYFHKVDIDRCLSQKNDRDVADNGSGQLPPSVRNLLSTLISLLLNDLNNSDRPESNLLISQYFSDQTSNHQIASALLSSSLGPHDANTPAEPSSTFVPVFSSLSQSFHRNQDYLPTLRILIHNLISHSLDHSWPPSAFAQIIQILRAATQSFLEASENQFVQDDAFPCALVSLWKHAILRVNQPHTSNEITTILGSCWSFIFGEQFFRLVLSANERFAFFVVAMVYPSVTSSNDLKVWSDARDWCLNFINISTNQFQQMCAFDAFLCLLTIPSNNRPAHLSVLQSSLSSFLQKNIAKKETISFFEEITRRTSQSSLLAELVLCEKTLTLLINDVISQSTTRELSHKVLMSSLSHADNTNVAATSIFPDFLHQPQGADPAIVPTSPQQHPLYPVYLVQLVDIVTRSQQPLFLDLVHRDFLNLRSANVAYSTAFLTKLFVTLVAVPKDAAKLWPTIPGLLGDPHHHQALQSLFLRMNSQQLSYIFSNQTQTPLAQSPLHQINAGAVKFRRPPPRQTENVHIDQDISASDPVLHTLLLISLGDDKPIEGLSFLTKLLPNLPQSVASSLISHTSQCLNSTFRTDLPRISLSLVKSAPYVNAVIVFIQALLSRVDNDTLTRNATLLIRLLYLTVSAMVSSISVSFADPKMAEINAFVEKVGWNELRLSQESLTSLSNWIYTQIISNDSLFTQLNIHFLLPQSFLLPTMNFCSSILKKTAGIAFTQKHPTLHIQGPPPDPFQFLSSDVKANLAKTKLELVWKMNYRKTSPKDIHLQLLSLHLLPFNSDVWKPFRNDTILSTMLADLQDGKTFKNEDYESAVHVIKRIKLFPDLIPPLHKFLPSISVTFDKRNDRELFTESMNRFCVQLMGIFNLIGQVARFSIDPSVVEAHSQDLLSASTPLFLLHELQHQKASIRQWKDVVNPSSGITIPKTMAFVTKLMDTSITIPSLGDLRRDFQGFGQPFSQHVNHRVWRLLELVTLMCLPFLATNKRKSFVDECKILIAEVKVDFAAVHQSTFDFKPQLVQWSSFVRSITQDFSPSSAESQTLTSLHLLLRGLHSPLPPAPPKIAKDHPTLAAISTIISNISSYFTVGEGSLVSIEQQMTPIKNSINNSIPVKIEICRHRKAFDEWVTFVERFAEPRIHEFLVFLSKVIAPKVPPMAPELKIDQNHPKFALNETPFKQYVQTINKGMKDAHLKIRTTMKSLSQSQSAPSFYPQVSPQIAYLVPSVKRDIESHLSCISKLEATGQSLDAEKLFLTQINNLTPPSHLPLVTVNPSGDVIPCNHDLLAEFNRHFNTLQRSFSIFVTKPLDQHVHFEKTLNEFVGSLPRFDSLNYLFHLPDNQNALTTLSWTLSVHLYSHLDPVHRTEQTISNLVNMPLPPLTTQISECCPSVLRDVWMALNTFVTTLDQTMIDRLLPRFVHKPRQTISEALVVCLDETTVETACPIFFAPEGSALTTRKERIQRDRPSALPMDDAQREKARNEESDEESDQFEIDDDNEDDEVDVEKTSKQLLRMKLPERSDENLTQTSTSKVPPKPQPLAAKRSRKG